MPEPGREPAAGSGAPAAPAQGPGPRIFHGWWIVLTGTLAISLSGGATTYVFSVLIPAMERDLGWSRAELVGVITVAALVKGGISAPIGPLFDRYGSRAFMTGGAVLGGACFMLTSLVAEVWQFYLLVGVGVALSVPALEDLGPRTAVANWFIRKRPAAFAVLTPGRSISGIVLVPIAHLLMTTYSWRAVYLAVGLAELLVLAPLCWLVVRRRPEDVGLLPDGAAPPSAGVRASAQAGTHVHLFPDPVWTRGQVLRTRTYWLLAAGFFLVALPSSSIYIHMGSYMQDKGLTAAAAAAGLGVYGFGALCGRPVWAFVVTHSNIRWALTAFALSYATAILGYTVAASQWTLYTAVFFLGLIIGGSAQLVGQVWPDYFGRRVVGAITGLATLVNMPATASGALILALALEATGSYTPILLVWAGIAYTSALFFAVARRPDPPAAEAS